MKFEQQRNLLWHFLRLSIPCYFMYLYLPCMLVCTAMCVDLYASYAKRFTAFCYYVVIEECGISFNVSSTVICVLYLLHSVCE